MHVNTPEPRRKTWLIKKAPEPDVERWGERTEEVVPRWQRNSPDVVDTAGRFAKVPHGIISGLKGAEGATDLLVLTYMMGYADWETGLRCFPSLSRLAEETGLSRSTVQVSIGRLELRGLIERVEGSKRKTVEYAITHIAYPDEPIFAGWGMIRVTCENADGNPYTPEYDDDGISLDLQVTLGTTDWSWCPSCEQPVTPGDHINYTATIPQHRACWLADGADMKREPGAVKGHFRRTIDRVLERSGIEG